MIDEKTIQELKAKLLEEKEKLEKDLGRIAYPINEKKGDYETSYEDIGSNKDDNATEVDQYTQNLSVETALEKKLQEIIDALGRMEKGVYGKCENCNKDIPVERLRANPSARLCLDC